VDLYLLKALFNHGVQRMGQTTLRDLTLVSDTELLAEQQLLLAQSMDLTDQGVRLHRKAERHAADGPEPDHERFRQVHVAYMQVHKRHMQVHAEFVSLHEELKRRGRYI
jgi:hypothetical protein